MLTIVYQTARKQPMIDWFFDSLERQRDGEEFKIVVVDFWKDERPLDVRGAIHVSPKPNVWQGKHRLTKQNWFAASNSRNTGLCYAQDGYIAYVDDLSVLMPTWLSAVRQAMREGYIALGAYRKVKNLVVKNGVVESYAPHSEDSRAHKSTGDQTSCGGSWLFGCSLALSVQALLDVNGWPEMCDGLSFEDCILGMVIGNTNKYSFRYDKRMLTYESEEHHHIEPAFRREDWHFENGVLKQGGNSASDKSHNVLNMAGSLRRFDHYLGDGFLDIAELRRHILNGGEFPIRTHPLHDWYAKTLLSEL